MSHQSDAIVKFSGISAMFYPRLQVKPVISVSMLTARGAV